MKRRNCILAASAIGMLIIILDSRAAFQATGQGLKLCLTTLIPALFPFMILSSPLTSSFSGRGSRCFAPIEKLLRTPAGSGSLFLIGLLGGYPVGARCLRQAFDEERLSEADACRMLSFCSNAGPSFLFGIIGSFFPRRKYPWLLWGIHILSAAAVAIVTPGKSAAQKMENQESSITVHQVMEQAVHTMGIVCGWVIFFRMILSFLDRWVLWAFPVPVRVIISGIVELSNGCILLGEIPDLSHRFLAAAVMLGFGGICVTMQTKSLWGELPFVSYIRGKVLQTGFSILFAMDYLWLFEAQNCSISRPCLIAGNLIIASYLGLTRGRKKNIVAFPGNMMYNRLKAHK